MTLTGFALVALSAFLHAAWNLGARRVNGSLGVILLGLWLSCLAFLPWAAVVATAPDFTATNLAQSALTGILVGIYVLFLTGAYGVEELTFVYPISRGIGLVGTAAFGVLCFHETVSEVGTVGLALVLGGTLLIGVDRHRKDWKKGFSFAFLSGTALVGAYVLGKAMAKAMHPVVYSVCLFVACALTMTPFVVWRHRDSLETAWRSQKAFSLAIGVSAVLSYLLVLFAFRLDSAGLLIGVREISVAFAAIGGRFLLHEPISARKSVAIAAILAGALLLKGG